MILMNASKGDRCKKMIKKRNGTFFCPAIHGDDKYVSIAVIILYEALVIIGSLKGDKWYFETIFMVNLIVISPFLFIYFKTAYDGVYLTTDNKIYYKRYCINHQIDISQAEAAFILDSVIINHGSEYYQVDSKTGERLKSVVLTRKIDSAMFGKYYYSKSFNRKFPWTTYPAFIYDEEFVKKLKELNPSIRIINTTAGE